MTNVTAKLLINIHQSKQKQIFFLEGNCFKIASTVSEYTQLPMLLMVGVDGTTNLLWTDLYHR